MIDETKIRSLRYKLERENLGLVGRSNYSVCAKIAADKDDFWGYLSPKWEAHRDPKIFSAWLKAAGDDAIIISDTHPITSFLVVFPPGYSGIRKPVFYRECGCASVLRYGLPFFRNFAGFADLSAQLQKKYSGKLAWYIAKMIGGADSCEKILTFFLNWIDSFGGVIYTETLAGNDASSAAQHGFFEVESGKIGEMEYHGLIRPMNGKKTW